MSIAYFPFEVNVIYAVKKNSLLRKNAVNVPDKVSTFFRQIEEDAGFTAPQIVK